MSVNAALAKVKTVADPIPAYTSLKPIWSKCRAVCNGERYVKDYDGLCDTISFSNMLIPFSPSMSQQQYNFYKAEAELPGICAQFSKMLVGGLLRKKPIVTLPKDVNEEATEWINSSFGQDDSSLTAFLDKALWEEVQTSRAWVYVDHPTVPNADLLSKEDRDKIKPFPVIWEAEFVISWKMSKSASTGRDLLERVITRGFTEDFSKNEFHSEQIETVWVHELNESGNYQIRVFKCVAPTSDVQVINGITQSNAGKPSAVFELAETITNITMFDKPLKYIPAWPLNGSVATAQPIITPIVDKEISLYNKISRRNHLLYGAATYTPVISSNMGPDEFQDVVDAGLGSWIHLQNGDTVSVLPTPTEALADMDRAIQNSIEEIARLGIRMLSPESDQSGVALQLRNASQTAQLGTLNSKVSSTMSQVIACMLNWRYDTAFEATDVDFTLSTDFNPTPLGADWLRLATEWYQGGLIPRSVWLGILKHNDMLEPDYDDEEGQKEIVDGMDLIIPPGLNDDYAGQIDKEKPPKK